MIKILVTGATGFLGSALVETMVADVHYSPVAALRASSAASSDLQSIIVGDMNTSTDWSLALAGIDVVIHTAARVHVMQDNANDPLTEFRRVNLEGTMALALQAVQAGIKRFVFISSIKVNGEMTTFGDPFTADDIPAPVDPYGISKAETEQALLDLAASTGLEVVIIRPVLVYGPGVKANFRNMIKLVRAGIPLPFSLVHNMRSLIALENLISFIMLCADIEKSPQAANQVFLISDGEDVSTPELLRKIGVAFDHKARLLPVPLKLMAFIARLFGKANVTNRLFGSLQVDSSKARNLLGWKPVITMDEQLRKMVIHK